MDYSKIFHENVRDRKLSIRAKLFYGELFKIYKEQGYCDQQNRYFADMFGVCKGSVGKWLRELQVQDLIYVEVKRTSSGTTRKIYLLDENNSLLV